MHRLTLAEHTERSSVQLSAIQVDALRELAPSVDVSPTYGKAGAYDLTPGSEVGVIQIPSLTIEIAPKLPIHRVLFMMSYALGLMKFFDETVPISDEPDLVEAIIPMFHAQVRQATQAGLLQGYRAEEDSLRVVRGQIHINEQIRRRFGMAVPLEVRYDEFTPDIDHNRLLKAAVRRLAHLTLRLGRTRRMVSAMHATFANVSDVVFEPTRLPELPVTPLNLHYQPAIQLARLILRSRSLELADGRTSATAFLIDMNRVFEDFVVIGLREALGLSETVFPQGARGRKLWLDKMERVRLEPDISWWDSGKCVFVGDVKYKRVTGSGVPNADIYQVLSYAVATHLPSALVIYAAGESAPATHEIPYTDKSLQVVTLDLTGNSQQLMERIHNLARLIIDRRLEVHSMSSAA